VTCTSSTASETLVAVRGPGRDDHCVVFTQLQPHVEHTITVVARRRFRRPRRIFGGTVTTCQLEEEQCLDQDAALAMIRDLAHVGSLRICALRFDDDHRQRSRGDLAVSHQVHILQELGRLSNVLADGRTAFTFSAASMDELESIKVPSLALWEELVAIGVFSQPRDVVCLDILTVVTVSSVVG
jgi:hypothetical protein